MNNYVYHLDYPFNKTRLISEIHSQTLTKFSELNPDWLRSSVTGVYGWWIINHFEQFASGKILTGYYKQPAGTVVHEHKDTKCKCRINVKLTDDNSILIMDGQEIQYDAALLNVHEYIHSVNKADKDRILFSIIYLEDSFNNVKEKIHASRN